MPEKIQWKPNEGQQTYVLSLPADIYEILYGGARGGGKTDAGIAWLLKDVHNPRFRALVVRRNADDLSDWIDRAQRRYANQAQLVGNPGEFRFKSGAIIKLGHLKDENAYTKYQGHEYHRILIEELTLIPTEQSYIDLISSCRSTVDGIKPQIFATTNPGGPGHRWVKERFRISQPNLHNKVWRDPKSTLLRIYVPARINDNPVLISKDPGYIKFLEALPPERRRAWLEGSWDDPEIKGAYYTDEVNQARNENRVGNFPHDRRRPVYTWWDLGRDGTRIGFFQKVDGAWNVVDYYENQGLPLAHYAQVLRQKQQLHNYYYEKHFAPHDLDREIYDTDENRLENARRLGIYFEIVPKTPIEDGIEALRSKFSLLRFNKDTCDTSTFPKHSLLEALENYRKEWDEEKQDYKPKPRHDWASHAADMMRYWAVTPDYMIQATVKASDWHAQVTHFT